MAETLTHKEEHTNLIDISDTDVNTFMHIDETPQGDEHKEGTVSERVQNAYQLLNQLLNKLNPSSKDLMKLKDNINSLGKIPIKVNGKYELMSITCSTSDQLDYSSDAKQLYIVIRNDNLGFAINYLYNTSNKKEGVWINTIEVREKLDEKDLPSRLSQSNIDHINKIRIAHGNWNSWQKTSDEPTINNQTEYYIANGQMVKVTDTEGNETYNNSTMINPFLEAGLEFINTRLFHYLQSIKQ